MADPVYDGIDVITVSSPLSWRPPSCFFLPSSCRSLRIWWCRRPWAARA